MSDSPSTNNCPVITISNELDNEVSVYDTFDTNDNGVITYTLLVKIAANTTDDNVQTIHEANRLIVSMTGDITINNGTKNYENFPVKEISVAYVAPPNSNPFAPNQPQPTQPTQPTSYTVTSNDLNIMTETLTFIQYTDSNPDGTLAKAFNTALTEGTSKGGSLENSLNTFFNSYPDTQGCTVESWTAVTNWMNSYPSAWQGTYYLYNLPSSSAAASGTKMEFIATMTVNNTTEFTDCATLKVESSGESSSLEFYPAREVDSSQSSQDSQSSQKFIPASLGYSDISSDTSIQLMPAWSNVSVTTGSKTTLELGSCATGTINGTNVYGTNEKLNLPQHDNYGHETWQDYVNMITGVVGTVFSGGIMTLMLAEFLHKRRTAKTEEERQKVDDDYGPDVQNQIQTHETDASDTSSATNTYDEANEADEDAYDYAETRDELTTQAEELTQESDVETPTPQVENDLAEVNADQANLDADNYQQTGIQADEMQENINQIETEEDNQLDAQQDADLKQEQTEQQDDEQQEEDVEKEKAEDEEEDKQSEKDDDSSSDESEEGVDGAAV